jgi:hypothetical protein
MSNLSHGFSQIYVDKELIAGSEQAGGVFTTINYLNPTTEMVANAGSVSFLPRGDSNVVDITVSVVYGSSLHEQLVKERSTVGQSVDTDFKPTTFTIDTIKTVAFGQAVTKDIKFSYEVALKSISDDSLSKTGDESQNKVDIVFHGNESARVQVISK